MTKELKVRKARLAVRGLDQLMQKKVSNYIVESMKILNDKAEGIEKEIPFQNIDFSKYQDVQSFILHIALNGSSQQKTCLASYFDDACVFGMPEINPRGDRDKALKVTDYIENEIKYLAASFGGSFNGDVHALAYDIMTEYGGLTYLDCVKFFHNAKLCKYKSEMQHISSRGVTREFLLDWLDKYIHKRDSVKEGIRPKKELIKTESKESEKSVKELAELAEKKRLLNMALLREAKGNKIKNQTLEELLRLNIFSVFFKGEKIENELKKYMNTFESKIKGKYNSYYGNGPIEGLNDAKDEVIESRPPDYEDYLDVMKRRHYNKIDNLISKTSVVKMALLIVMNCCSDADSVNKKFGFNYNDQDLNTGIRKAIVRLKGKVEGLWYEYARKCKEGGFIAQERSFWVKRYIRMYFIDKCEDGSGDFLFEFING